ncbi:MAG TPA: radical SAM/SPASM domain-containing protein [Bacteroidales bacterium]|nr:radical SAM/SPASM domain-containing protein [Bacteroidales bacterium]
MIQQFVRPANALLAGYSYIKSTVSGKTTVNGMPVSLGVELTNHCNLHCPECSSGSGRMKRPRGFMDVDLFSRVMKELGPYLCNLNLYFQGEPMLHPQFFSFLRNEKHTHSVVSTNGHFLDEENAQKIARSGLSKLIISLDGVDQDTYSAYRIGGNVDTVIKGIKNVAEAKKKYNSSVEIEIQFVVNKLNEYQIPRVREMAQRLKTSLSLKSMQIIDKENVGNWLPVNKKFRRYRSHDGEYIIKNSLPDRCARLWFNPVVTWDGKVVPCCFDKNAEFVMGDLNQDSFREIWNGPKYRSFRKSILSGRYMIDICRNCTSGLRGVKY